MKNTNDHTFLLCDLLHYDPSQKKRADLVKSLQEYTFLLQVSKNALLDFMAHDFEKFDSIVGENACQIRAVQIAVIAMQGMDQFQSTIDQIKNRLAKIENLLSGHSMDTLMREGRSLLDIVKQYELEIRLREDEFFIIQSYLLTEMKVCDWKNDFITSILRKDKCSPRVLQKKFPHISYSFLEKSANKIRKCMAMSSVEFVRQIARDLNNADLLKMVTNEFEFEHNDLLCLPAFWCFKAVFSLALDNRVPLVFHIKFLNKTDQHFYVADEKFIYFQPCSNTQSYIEIDPNEYDMKIPSCIIEGVVCPHSDEVYPDKLEWEKRFKQHSVIDMLLAMGADHRQYPNPDKSIGMIHEEYESYKNLAQRFGFSLSNPTTFFVQHIYCSQPVRKISGSSESILAGKSIG